MSDFEPATIKSIKSMLPNTLHKGNFFTLIEKIIITFLIGCLFHFSQAIWRQVQSKKLSTKYKEDECFRLNVKKLIALAFVPLDDIMVDSRFVECLIDFLVSSNFLIYLFLSSFLFRRR